MLLAVVFFACSTAKKDVETKVERVIAFEGQQVTGVTISRDERLFANFPRWREGVKYSVVEVLSDVQSKAYPNESWNSWTIGNAVTDSSFVCVQSVVMSNDKLFVIDTRNPQFKGVIESPMIYVFDLKTDKLSEAYQLSDSVFYDNSYVNDVRIDEGTQTAFFTDSGRAGLIVLDLESGSAKRVLDEHISTTAEVGYLTINDKKWSNMVHSDGIALDSENGMLYYHSLTGYNLYRVPTNALINATEKDIQSKAELVAKTAAPDGMIIYEGAIYYADLENHKILKMDLKTKEVSEVVSGAEVIWADTFTIGGGYLYYTNSRIHEASADVSDMSFSINKIKL